LTDKIQAKAEYVALIKDIIRAQTEEEADAIGNTILMSTIARETLLAEIAADPNELINIRAHAALLFVALENRNETCQIIVRLLSQHQSPLIRSGILHGFAELKNIERVREFLTDSHHHVAQTALEELEELEEQETP
jgi:hypothetical protein